MRGCSELLEFTMALRLSVNNGQEYCAVEYLMYELEMFYQGKAKHNLEERDSAWNHTTRKAVWNRQFRAHQSHLAGSQIYACFHHSRGYGWLFCEITYLSSGWSVYDNCRSSWFNFNFLDTSRKTYRHLGQYLTYKKSASVLTHSTGSCAPRQ